MPDNWPVGCPGPPDWLTEAVREEWERQAPRLFLAGRLGVQGDGNFYLYCTSYGHWVEMQTHLAELPEDVPSELVEPMHRAARGMARVVVDLAGKLGIHPGARLREMAAEASV